MNGYVLYRDSTGGALHRREPRTTPSQRLGRVCGGPPFLQSSSELGQPAMTLLHSAGTSLFRSAPPTPVVSPAWIATDR
jgi:hypothetical protein